MSPFQRILRDNVHIVKADGTRLGPYNASVSPNAITIMNGSIDVDDGDYVARSLPNGKEEIYQVLAANYSPGLSSIPANYVLKVRKTTELQGKVPEMKSTTINIHNSTGFQVGDYNTQHIQATFNELVQKIELSSASPAEKAEAKSRLAAFLEHPLVGSILGGAAGALLSALGA